MTKRDAVGAFLSRGVSQKLPAARNGGGAAVLHFPFRLHEGREH